MSNLDESLRRAAVANVLARGLAQTGSVNAEELDVLVFEMGPRALFDWLIENPKDREAGELLDRKLGAGAVAWLKYEFQPKALLRRDPETQLLVSYDAADDYLETIFERFGKATALAAAEFGATLALQDQEDIRKIWEPGGRESLCARANIEMKRIFCGENPEMAGYNESQWENIGINVGEALWNWFREMASPDLVKWGLDPDELMRFVRLTSRYGSAFSDASHVLGYLYPRLHARKPVYYERALVEGWNQALERRR